jgi:hypothetical protein
MNYGKFSNQMATYYLMLTGIQTASEVAKEANKYSSVGHECLLETLLLFSAISGYQFIDKRIWRRRGNE